MPFTHDDAAIMHNHCMATNCRQLAHTVSREGEGQRLQCKAHEVFKGVQLREGFSERLTGLRDAFSACSEACRERFGACETQDIHALRKWNKEVLQRAQMVRREITRLL